MIKNLKKISAINGIKYKGEAKINQVNQGKISFVIAILISLLFLILFHKKNDKINTKIISNGLCIFEIPNFFLLKTIDYFYDLRHFRQIQNSIIQNNINLKSQINYLQNIQDGLSKIDQSLLEQGGSVKYIVAKAISANKNLEYVVLNKGKNYDIHDYALVLQNNNVIGFVFKALEDKSFFVPISSPNFKIPAKIITTNTDDQGNKTEETILGLAEGGYSGLSFKFNDNI